MTELADDLERLRMGGKILGLMEAEAIALKMATRLAPGPRALVQRLAARINEARGKYEKLEETDISRTIPNHKH